MKPTLDQLRELKKTHTYKEIGGTPKEDFFRLLKYQSTKLSEIERAFDLALSKI